MDFRRGHEIYFRSKTLLFITLLFRRFYLSGRTTAKKS